MGFHKNMQGSDLHSPQGKSPTPIQLDDDTPGAYLIEDTGSLNYLRVDTTDSAEEVTLGNATTNPDVVMPGSGKVGIGTDSPTEKVDINVTGVNGGLRVINDTDNAYLKLDAPADEAAYIDFSTGESNDWQIGRRPGSNDLTVYDNDGADDYVFTWEAGGNVGIGTTNPTTKLHVDGAVTVSGKIHGVVAPDLATDAANKAYVDAVAPSAWDGTSGSSPALGGDLDCNGNALKFDADTGIKDEAGNESLLIGKTTDAVNHFALINAAAGGNATAATSTAPIIRSIGTGNVDMGLETQGTGTVTLRSRNSGAVSGVLSINNEADTFAVNLTVPLAEDLDADYTLTLPVDDGDSGQVMQSDGSGVLSWVTPSAGGGGLTYENKTANFSAAVDYFYTVSSSGGDVTVTLPAVASSTAKTIDVCHKVIGNDIIFDGNASETINGALTMTIGGIAYQNITLFCTGSEWLVR